MSEDFPVGRARHIAEFESSPGTICTWLIRACNEVDKLRAQVATLAEALDRIMGEADCQHAVAIATDALAELKG